MLMVLESDTMNLIDPLGQTLLHTQPIGSIRVWGVGRDNGRSVCTPRLVIRQPPKYNFAAGNLSPMVCFSTSGE